ncbi:MAG: hypothetical protein ACP5MH_11090 [Thermoproteus sp.]
MTLVVTISRETRTLCLKGMGTTKYGGAHPSWACLKAVIREYLTQRLESERGNIMCVKFKQIYGLLNQVTGGISQSLMSWVWRPLLLEVYGPAVVHVDERRAGRSSVVCFNTQKLRELLAYE